MGTSLSEKELGVVQVVLERYNREWLPALLDMRKKVDRGETLDDRELSLLSKAIEEARGGATFAKSHPEFKSLIDRATALYDHIEARNKENADPNQ